MSQLVGRDGLRLRGEATVVLDESKGELVMVGASIFDINFNEVEASIAKEFLEASRFFHLEGWESFERFKREGFHASRDGWELRIPFVNFMARTRGMASVVYFTDGTTRPDLGETATLAVLYRELLVVLLRRLSGYSRVLLIFEQNQELDRYFGRIVESARRRVRSGAVVEVQIAEKTQPHSLAVIDYTMGVFRRWYLDGGPTEPTDATFRNWRAVRGGVSYIRSLEDGTLVRRGQPVPGKRGRGPRSTTSQFNARDSRTQEATPPSQSIVPENPILLDEETLRQSIGYDMEEVHKLGDLVESETGYLRRRVRKRRGGTRLVFQPVVPLSRFHRNLKTLLESRLAYQSHPAAFGYVPGGTTFGHASNHLRQRVVLNIDIDSFFDTIGTERVVEALVRNGCEPELANALTRTFVVGGRLAPGFSLSPYLSNLVFEPTDIDLTTASAEWKVAYSRFADDLTFSGDFGDEVLDVVEGVLTVHGWRLNPSKTRFMRAGGPQYVTGLYVGGDRPHLPRRVKRQLRQESYYIGRFGLSDHLSRRKKGRSGSSLAGWVRYANQVDPAFALQTWRNLSLDSSSFKPDRWRPTPATGEDWTTFLEELGLKP